MRRLHAFVAGVLLLGAVSSLALAQAPAPEPTRAEPPEPTRSEPTRSEPDAATAARLAALEAENQRLRERNQRLSEDLEDLGHDVAYLDERVSELLPIRGRLSGYVDMGFFYAAGTGAGHRADIGNQVFPELGEVSDSWVFMGDPLSTAVNARGEPATTGDSRAIAFDSIGARSAFVVNAVNVRLYTGIGADLSLTTAFDLVPRSRDISDPDGHFLGDFLDVKLAYAEYRPLAHHDVSLFAGKLDSALGYEYRVQEAPDRVGVTPSLLCRYLCGHPVGVKARVGLADGLVFAQVAVTNGSHFQESFVFADEIDENRGKTVAGRLSVAPPWADELEIGVSGAIGTQDGQADERVLQHHIGADARVLVDDVEIVAEYIDGLAPGATDVASPVPCDLAPCLDYRGLYGRVSYRASNHLIPYARVDWRDALHRHGRRFAYVSKLWRATAGVRVELGAHVIIKGEYTVNRELGRIPAIPNDVLTTSLIVTY